MEAGPVRLLDGPPRLLDLWAMVQDDVHYKTAD
jgi:hypothetical protein